VEAMAKRHLSTLRAVQPTGPYRLGGNCNGGMIAFEMARLLRHQGEEIELLILVRASGRTLHLGLHDLVARGIAATGLAKGGGDRVRWRKRLHEFTEEWGKASVAGKTSLVWQKILNLPRLVRRPPVAPESALSISSEGEGDSWREGLRDTYMQAARNYLPGPYDRPVTLFWPETDTETPEEAASWWRKVAPTVELQVLPGDHLTYATVHVAEFARQLMARLD
jgi:Thioesterase domain